MEGEEPLVKNPFHEQVAEFKFRRYFEKMEEKIIRLPDYLRDSTATHILVKEQ